MKKFIVFLFPLFLFGIGFEEFKDKAVKNIFVSKALSIKKSIIQNRIKTRSNNPKLDFQMNRFKSKNESYNLGYAISINMSVLPKSFKDDSKKLSLLDINLTKSIYKKEKASFIASLEKLYTEYIYEKSKISLLKNEIKIADSLLNIVKDKFKRGNETKAEILKLALEKKRIENQLLMQQRVVKKAYFKLLEYANVDADLDSSSFLYTFEDFKNRELQNQELLIYRIKRDYFLKEVEVNSHTIDNYELFSEFEKEPDQDVIKIGVSFPLPIFNKKKEERELSLINAKKVKYEEELLKKRLKITLRNLKEKVLDLKKEYNSLTELKRDQKKLLNLYEEGYKIDKSSLIELLLSKNNLLKIDGFILDTLFYLNLEIIKLKYLQGAYNE